MVLKTTIEQMKKLMLDISHDLEKAQRGNRAAAQRVRTNTIKFAKVAKQYRKESISETRKGKTTKRKSAKKRKAAAKPAKKSARKKAGSRRR